MDFSELAKSKAKIMKHWPYIYSIDQVTTQTTKILNSRHTADNPRASLMHPTLEKIPYVKIFRFQQIRAGYHFDL